MPKRFGLAPAISRLLASALLLASGLINAQAAPVPAASPDAADDLAITTLVVHNAVPPAKLRATSNIAVLLQVERDPQDVLFKQIKNSYPAWLPLGKDTKKKIDRRHCFQDGTVDAKVNGTPNAPLLELHIGPRSVTGPTNVSVDVGSGMCEAGYRREHLELAKQKGKWVILRTQLKE